MKFPWKQGFLKIPPGVRAKLGGIDSDFVLVAATKKLALTDIASGLYGHLGLKLEGDVVVARDPVLPSAAIGKWSCRNAEGWEIKRTDLPKITKTFIWETPNFGDGSRYGWHTHYRDREVYQRQLFEPPMLRISIEILSDNGAPTLLVKFAIDRLFDRTHANFENDLLFALNLLQENTGVCGVFASDAARQDFDAEGRDSGFAAGEAEARGSQGEAVSFWRAAERKPAVDLSVVHNGGLTPRRSPIHNSPAARFDHQGRKMPPSAWRIVPVM